MGRFNRHQKRLIQGTNRFNNIAIHRVHEFPNLLGAFCITVERFECRAFYKRNLVTRELVKCEQISNFHLYQLQKLGVVHHIHLVYKHDQVGHTDLSREQNMLAGLWHRPVRSADHQDSPIHLRRACNHILDIICMSRAIRVRIMPLFCLILYRGGINRNTSGLLLRSFIDLIIGEELGHLLICQHLGDCRRKRGLPVIYMPNGTDV
mmetsp:Transcript_4725/g.8717  ORF Transcript_4725/g.8717 Transcript_4725/m.8717 type:complete len:207 (-) Transcript_4725:402-1022(-)